MRKILLLALSLGGLALANVASAQSLPSPAFKAVTVGGSTFSGVGTTPGTVASGADSRFSANAAAAAAAQATANGPLPYFGVPAPAACDYSAWTGFLGGTQSPNPKCFGTQVAPSPSIKFPSLTGIAHSDGTAASVGDTSGEGLTQGLLQCQTAVGNTAQENCLTLNMLVNTGGGGLPLTSFNEKVDLYMPVRVMPGGSNAWGINVDIGQMSGVGSYPMYGIELDVTNNNMAFPGVSAHLFMTTLSAFPITAWELLSNAHGPQSAVKFTGSTTAGSKVVAVTTGDPTALSHLYQGEPIVDGSGAIPKWSHVSSVNTSASPPTVTLDAAATSTQTGDAVTATPPGARYGILFNSPDIASDTTIYDGGNAYTSLAIGGTHHVGISIQSGVDYAITMGVGQPICQNGLDACWAYLGSNTTTFAQGGGNALTLVGGGANGIAMLAASTGNAPVLRPNPASGGDSNVNLSLQSFGQYGTVLVQKGASGNRGSFGIAGDLFGNGGSPTVAETATTPATSPLSSQASDLSGTLTSGTGSTKLVVTWKLARYYAPDCAVASPTGTLFTYSTNTAALTINTASQNGGQFSYVCAGL